MITINDICDEVGKYHGVPVHWFMNRSHSRTRTKCRQYSIALIRELKGMSWAEIACEFGMDESNVRKAHRKVVNEPEFKRLRERFSENV